MLESKGLRKNATNKIPETPLAKAKQPAQKLHQADRRRD
jgi:hypothetical protein